MAGMSLKELTAALKQEQFTPRTDEELQKEATDRYTEVYNSMRGTAQQRQQAIDEAYQREAQALAGTLATSKDVLAQGVARSNAAIDDYINTRSMQRTSYGASSKGSITDNMNKAAAALMQQYATANRGIENNRILLAEQLAGTLAQYDKDFLTDVQAYVDRQKQLDYDRKVAADAAYNDLQMALFEYGKGGSGGGGGGRRYGGSGSSAVTGGSTSNLWTALKGMNVAGMSSADRQTHNAIMIASGNNQNSESTKKEVSGGVKG